MNFRAWMGVIVAVGMVLLPPAAEGESVWQGFRNQEPTASLPPTFGLQEAWSRDLGSGYSNVALAGDRLLATFTAGEDDVLAAFDRHSGEELWRLKIAEKYAGHHGSDDGPIAPPSVDGDRVYALGATGHLVAARLADGKELWRLRHDESNSQVPHYGYCFYPTPVDGLVLLPAGGKGRTLNAYDRESGELVWAVGDDSVRYQSPLVTELDGRRQIVMASNFEVRGLDPETGAELWTYRHTPGKQQEPGVHPTRIDDEHLLLSLFKESEMIRVRRDGESWTVESVWREPPFGGATVLPLHHDGVLYGYSGRFLTAVDPQTGELLWRTRHLPGFNISLVDGRLAVLSEDGYLVVADAGPDAYREIARVKVFEKGGYSYPAFMDGNFYVRHQDRLAAYRVDADTANDAAPQPEPDPYRYLGKFGAFVQELEAMPEAERQAAVDAYFADRPRRAWIEDDGSAHVTYRGHAEDISLHGTLVNQRREDERLLHAVAGTDLFYRSLKVATDDTYNYGLSVDFEPLAPDPTNPLQEDFGYSLVSELRGPDFRGNPHVAEPGPRVARGTLDTFRFQSEHLGAARTVKVWRPASFDGAKTYPLLVVTNGLRAARNGAMVHTLDNMVGQTVKPLVVLFVSGGPRDWVGDRAAAFDRYFLEELLPHVQRHYRTSDERVVLGESESSVAALRLALGHPDLFDHAVLQSFHFKEDYRDGVLTLIDESTATPSLRLETGPRDISVELGGGDAQADTQLLAERLEAKGLEVERHTFTGHWGWKTWRSQHDLILEAFFPSTDED